MSPSSTSSDAGVELARWLLRGAVGGTMIAHGVKHLRTLKGTAGWFGSIGFARPELQAKASAVSEIGSGALLVAGAATPAAAAGVIGTLGVAAGSVHVPNGFFVTSEGYEYVLVLSVAAAGLAALGPGRFSVDHALGWDTKVSGRTAGLAAIALGVASAVTHLRLFWTKPTA
jgi:putative oxidoreductase